MRPLVEADWVATRLHDPRVALVDCRFVLGDPDAGRRAYVGGHLPGAAFCDLETDLSGPHGPGRHPLPAPEAFARSARRAGIRADGITIAYDDGSHAGAARLWWLLRHMGQPRAAVLRGGLAAWPGPLRAGYEPIRQGDLRPRPAAGDVVTRGDVLAGLGQPGRVLIDARAPERYRGEREPIDPVAGHIPGAVNVPFTAVLRPPDDGGSDATRRLAELARADAELVAYCGSGVTACVVLLALADAGRDDARLYPGSWSDWCAHDLPVATGEAP